MIKYENGKFVVDRTPFTIKNDSLLLAFKDEKKLLKVMLNVSSKEGFATTSRENIKAVYYFVPNIPEIQKLGWSLTDFFYNMREIDAEGKRILWSYAVRDLVAPNRIVLRNSMTEILKEFGMNFL